MNRKLSIEQVKLIPNLIEMGKSYRTIASELGVSVRTVQYWVNRLKMAEVELKITRGPKPWKLKDNESN